MTYSILILICSINLGQADCQQDTAIDVVRGPHVESVMMCGMAGQAMIARTVLLRNDGQEYMKLLCLPSDMHKHWASSPATPSGEELR
jgi:hypothetical protein